MTEDQNPAAWVAVLADDEATAVTLIDALHAAGLQARGLGACTEMTQFDPADAPQAVVLGLPARAGAWPCAAGAAPRGWDGPVLVVGPVGRAGLAEELPAHGVHHWQASLVSCPLAVSLAFATAVHRRDLAQRQRIDTLQGQLAEQKLVARAKGVLMAAQRLSEDEAFSLLRSGAMQTRLPMGDVARSVVDAAVWAEAVNRAGQLRWLSQRCIAAAAQRLARIDAPAARKLQQQSHRRAREILDALGRLPLPEAARAALGVANAAWKALTDGLALRLDLASLAAADRSAEAALHAAEALTGALQAVGSSPMLRVVNLCGRQRMRAQRLVKLGLLARLDMTAGDPSDALELMDAFSATLRELEQLPLGSAEITLARQLAADRWRDMGLALRSDDAATLVQGGEALLASLDALTSCWERSLLLLLGWPATPGPGPRGPAPVATAV